MTVTILQGDARAVLRSLPANSVHCVVTSPPYLWLRSYLPEDHPQKASELGSEKTPEAFVGALLEVFAEVHRVLRPDGLAWVNLGDSFAAGGRGGGGALHG